MARQGLNTSALDVERKVGGEEPVAQTALVGLGPVAHLVDGLALGAHVEEGLHE